MTDVVCFELGAEFSVALCAGLPSEASAVFRIVDAPRLSDLNASDTSYPAPYAAGFAEQLGEYTRTHRPSRMSSQAYQDLAVVLVDREAEERDVREIAVLNGLAMTAAMRHRW